MKTILVSITLMLSSLTSFGACDQAILNSAKTIYRLKLGEKATIVGIRGNVAYKEIIGCSDGIQLFVGDYVPSGECLQIPIQNQINGEYATTVITCE